MGLFSKAVEIIKNANSTAEAVKILYGFEDKKSREFKSASRQVQRIAKAEREGKELKLSAQTTAKYEPIVKAREEAAKPAPAPIVDDRTPEEKRYDRMSERATNRMNNLETDRVVIRVVYKDGSQSTLGAHGGIKIETINEGGGLGGFCPGQADNQGYGDDTDEIDAYIVEDYYDFADED